MKISKRQLKKMNACKKGLKRFIDQTNNTSELVDVANLVGGENTYGDLLWLAGETISKERIVRFACDCALLNIELIKPYVNDYNYNLIVKFLKDPSKNVAAFYAAYDASDATTSAAEYVNAANAAKAAKAAYNAACYTVNAVNAVTYSAYAAAAEAAKAVANAAYASDAFYAAKSRNCVDKLLIEMFNEVDT